MPRVGSLARKLHTKLGETLLANYDNLVLHTYSEYRGVDIGHFEGVTIIALRYCTSNDYAYRLVSTVRP